MRLLCIAGTAGWIVTELLSQSRHAEQPSKGLATSVPGQAVVRFRDDFERDLSGWQVAGLRGVSIQPSPDGDHGRVLALTPHGDVHVLVKGSEGWSGGKRIEGDVMFPTSVDSYWQRFRVETLGDTCHFCVGDMDVPQMTFALSGQVAGAVGLQPRSVGGEVWVDNVVVSSIPRLSYRGPPRPDLKLEHDSLLTIWSVLGPLERTRGFSHSAVATPKRGLIHGKPDISPREPAVAVPVSRPA